MLNALIRFLILALELMQYRAPRGQRDTDELYSAAVVVSGSGRWSIGSYTSCVDRQRRKSFVLVSRSDGPRPQLLSRNVGSLYVIVSLAKTACAAANRATGTRNGLHET
jgi:hypothetical protein